MHAQWFIFVLFTLILYQLRFKNDDKKSMILFIFQEFMEYHIIHSSLLVLVPLFD
jgi:hypothetical protein